MGLTLIIGDVTKYLSEIAIGYSKSSLLLDITNYHSKLKGVYYTSLGDLDKEKLYLVGKKSDKIIYCPPDNWSSDDIEKNTLSILRDLKALDKKQIHDIHGNKINLPIDRSFLKIVDDRKTSDQQIWVVGCSFAHGAALEYLDQRYGQHVSNHFKKPISFLTLPGSSIDWACDQILRADIKSNDIVIWGITSVNRITWFDDRHEMIKLHFGFLTGKLKHYFDDKSLKTEEKMMMYQMLFDDSRLLLTIRHIEQVVSYCKKISANLVLLAHDELSLDRHAEWLISYLESIDNYLKIRFDSMPWTHSDPEEKDFFSLSNLIGHRKYIDGANNTEYKTFYKNLYEDLGHDKMHPGPLTHRHIADKIVDFIEKKQWIK